MYLAERFTTATVLSILTSKQERVHAMRFARERGVLDRMEYIVVESPDKVRVVSTQEAM